MRDKKSSVSHNAELSEKKDRKEEKKMTHRDGYDSHGLEGVMADSERPERP